MAPLGFASGAGADIPLLGFRAMKARRPVGLASLRLGWSRVRGQSDRKVRKPDRAPALMRGAQATDVAAGA